RLGGIGNVLVKRGLWLRRRCKSEFAAGGEVELASDGPFRRPAVVLDPLVSAGLKNQGFGELRALVLEGAGGERRLSLGAEMRARVAVEGDLAELVSRPRLPTAVVPGADDQEVLVVFVVPFEEFVALERAVKILLVEPAGDVQRRHGDALQVG